VQRGVAVQDPREAPYAAAYARSIGAVQAAAVNRELARSVGIDTTPAQPTDGETSLLNVLWRSALFPLMVIVALAWLAVQNLREERPRAQPPASHPSLSEARRPWYVLTDKRCFDVAQTLDGLSSAQRLELKVRTTDEIAANDPPAAAILALIHLESSLRADARALRLELAGKPAAAERRTARREARAGTRIFADHAAPSCARAFG
jgi:hypothetical protein